MAKSYIAIIIFRLKIRRLRIEAVGLFSKFDILDGNFGQKLRQRTMSLNVQY